MRDSSGYSNKSPANNKDDNDEFADPSVLGLEAAAAGNEGDQDPQGKTSKSPSFRGIRHTGTSGIGRMVQQQLQQLLSSSQLLRQWKGAADFCSAQLQVCVVLVIAYIGNNWKESYPRNDNHSYYMFWTMNAALLVVGALTLKHEPNARGGVQLLSRSQTEEWKGWMQWAFIMVRIYMRYACVVFIIVVLPLLVR